MRDEDDEEPEPKQKEKEKTEGGVGITPVSAPRADSRQHAAMLDAWRKARSLKKRRKSLASKFLEAAADLCRSANSATRELLSDVVKLAQGLARSMAEIRREVEEAFGVKMSWLEIENLRREAEADRIRHNAAELKRIIDEHLEWLEQQRLKREEEQRQEREEKERQKAYEEAGAFLENTLDSMNPYWEPDAHLTGIEGEDYNNPPPAPDYCPLQL